MGLSADGAPRLAAGRNICNKTLEILDRPPQAFFELDGRLPPELLPRQFDVGAPLGRIVGRKRFEHDLRARAGKPDYLFGELENVEFVRIPKVDRPDETFRVAHHAEKAFNHIVHEAEGARLIAVAEHRNVLAGERLHNEVADHSAVVGVHARPVGVEDPHHPDVQLVLAMVVGEQRLGAALDIAAFLEQAPAEKGAQKPRPAGSRASFLAALATGAEAVYCGLKQFTARMEAKNFTIEELRGLVELAYAKGTRVYVTLNTLVKPDELDAAGRMLDQLNRHVHPDAVIVQDLAMAPFVRQTGFAGEVIWSTSKSSGGAGGGGSGASGSQRPRRRGWVNVSPKPASQD